MSNPNSRPQGTGNSSGSTPDTHGSSLRRLLPLPHASSSPSLDRTSTEQQTTSQQPPYVQASAARRYRSILPASGSPSLDRTSTGQQTTSQQPLYVQAPAARRYRSILLASGSPSLDRTSTGQQTTSQQPTHAQARTSTSHRAPTTGPPGNGAPPDRSAFQITGDQYPLGISHAPRPRSTYVPVPGEVDLRAANELLRDATRIEKDAARELKRAAREREREAKRAEGERRDKAARERALEALEQQRTDAASHQEAVRRTIEREAGASKEEKRKRRQDALREGDAWRAEHWHPPRPGERERDVPGRRRRVNARERDEARRRDLADFVDNQMGAAQGTSTRFPGTGRRLLPRGGRREMGLEGSAESTGGPERRREGDRSHDGR